MKHAPVYALALLLLLPPAAFAGGGAAKPVYPARTGETARLETLRRALSARKIPFSERPLLLTYGAFGTSLQTSLPAGAPPPPRAAEQTSFILAVPILSPTDARAVLPPVQEISFSQEVALAFIEYAAEQEKPATDSAAAPRERNFDIAVFFLADEWASGGFPAESANGAAWQDVLDTEGRSSIVYLDMNTQTKHVGIYTGKSPPRPPFANIKQFSAMLRKRHLPFYFSPRITPGAIPREIENQDTPVLHLASLAKEPFLGKTEVSPDAQVLAALLYEYAFAAAELRQTAAAGEDDRNYLAIALPGNAVVLGERSIILFVMLLATILFSVIFFIYKKRKHKAVLASGSVLTLLFAAGVFYSPSYRNAAPLPAPVSFIAIPAETAVNVTARTQRFLERTMIALRITCEKAPLHHRLYFEKETFDQAEWGELPFVYEAPLPARSGSEGILFYMGNYPPNPLDLEIALPAGLGGAFIIDTYWTDGTRVTTRTSF
jgi:hypothetical protein